MSYKFILEDLPAVALNDDDEASDRPLEETRYKTEHTGMFFISLDTFCLYTIGQRQAAIRVKERDGTGQFIYDCPFFC